MSYKVIDAFVANGLLNQRVQMSVPLDYKNASSKSTISICANITQKHNTDLHRYMWESVVFPKKCDVFTYLQGGPGFPCSVPYSSFGLTKVLVDKGHAIVFYDQRGTGLSSPIEVGTLIDVASSEHPWETGKDTTDKLLAYILNFRADSIVEDMERLRNALIGDNKWTLLGQSFGGFSSFTYLSKYAGSLKAAYVTGGVPPIGFTADDVYKKTYERTKERNEHYYAKYPQDVERVKRILTYLTEHRIELPNGGILSAERFQQLGLGFGASGGTDSLHEIVTKFYYALTDLGKPTYAVLTSVQNEYSFDTNVLYALFQEAIYCDGANEKGPKKSNWAADRLRHAPENKAFVANASLLASDEPVYFTGEMVFKSMFDDYAELAPLKKLAYALHEYEDWSPLYNVPVLEQTQWEDVPIVAATYFSDQYVDFELTMAVKKQIFQSKGNRNLRQYITNEFFHNGLRADPSKVLGSLFKLRHEDLD